jgi:predicted ABC-type ATPase
MNKKRLRIFAGPNGSGKSTFIRNFPSTAQRTLGYYVNADDIEQLLRGDFCLELEQFGISSSTDEIQNYFKNSTFAPIRLNDENLWKNFSIENDKLIVDKNLNMNSYIAADIAEFIRQNLLKSGLSFSYETVMSDEKKIDFLQMAKKEGYRIYLYFFATDDPMINVNRISLRVAQHGHSVEKEVIEKRYYKSLNNLREAVLLSDRAYLFDNSGKLSILIAEITDGKKVHVIDPEGVPNWFVKYLYKISL